MKFCEVCGEEIGTKDGENRCQHCEDIEDDGTAKKARAKANRKEREAALRLCGLVKVRGALGGTYWE
jgi:hypothetical protein